VNYSFLPEAEAEYIEAVRFYEEQQAKLGGSLINEFERAINLITERPQAWRLVHSSGIRRIGLLRFPLIQFSIGCFQVGYRLQRLHITDAVLNIGSQGLGEVSYITFNKCGHLAL